MFKFANNAQSTLASGITNVATSLTVSAGDGAKYPAITGADTFQITVVNSAGSFEIMQVTAVAGDVLTVTRAQEGTTAIAFTAGCTVDNRITAAALVDLRNASNLNAGTVPSARISGAYSGITGLGTLTGLTSSGDVSITSATASTSTTTGALIVNGGVGIGGNANVVGSVNAGSASAINIITVSGNSSGTAGGSFIATRVGGVNVIIIGNQSAIGGGAYSATPWLYSASVIHVPNGLGVDGSVSSTSTTTGSLVVTGGVGVSGAGYFGDRLFSGAAGSGGIWLDGGTAQFVGSVDATYCGIFNNGWIIECSSTQAKVMPTTTSTSSTTGALVVLGGIGVGGALNGGTVRSMSQTTLSSGQGCEIVFTGGTGFLFAFDRGTSSYLPLQIGGSTITLTNPTRVADTSASSSTTTGSLVLSGGLGLAGALYGTFCNFTSGSSNSAIVSSAVGNWACQINNSSNTASSLCMFVCGGPNSSADTGTILIGFYPSSAPGAPVGSIARNGLAVIYNTTSDRRLKEDDQDFDGLALINKLDFVDYRWTGTDRREYGVIAQDACDVGIPAFITPPREEDHYWQANYTALVPVIGRGQQQMSATIAALEARIAALEATIH